MAGRGSGPDFVEALARGLDVLACFDAGRPAMTLSEIAVAAELARPTARRLLLTLAELGYVRVSDNTFALTPKVLGLGMAYVSSLGLWDIARPHLEALVARTGESSSMAQLDGSDIVYVARVAVPKIIALRVEIGTRFPAPSTSLGKVLLAGLTPTELDATLREVRATGWALTDEQLARGIRSVAAPLRDGSGRVIAALNVTVHAAETSVATLTGDHLPLLLQAAGEVSADFARRQSVPAVLSAVLPAGAPAGWQPGPR